MPILPMGAMVAMADISAAFGLERDLHPFKICSEAKEHILDHVIGPNAEEPGLEFQSANADFPDATQGAPAD